MIENRKFNIDSCRKYVYTNTTIEYINAMKRRSTYKVIFQREDGW